MEFALDSHTTYCYIKKFSLGLVTDKNCIVIKLIYQKTVIYKNQEAFPRIFPRVFRGCDIENREKAVVGTRRQLKQARMKVTTHGLEKK